MSANPEQKNVRVLVVDDEQPMITLVRGVLNALGIFDVATAMDGEQALQVVQQDGPPFDLVISDWQMPVMDGIVLLERFRALHPGTPFVMLTAKNDVKAFNDAKRSGATYFFMKPISPEDLAARLASLFLIME
jgi:CheY-like chemotaxis protein